MALPELPVDIHEIITKELLSNIPSPLFAPIYQRDDDDTIGGDGDLESKHKGNYGERNEEHLNSAQALINWSSTCRHFRKLLSPQLFKSVILRSRPKSVASIKALMHTQHWTQIESFFFVATEHEYDEEGRIVKGEYGEEDEDEIPFTNATEDGLPKYDLEVELSELHSILSNLPPNLKSLTLDFPNGWKYEWTEVIMDGQVFRGGEDSAEQGLRYRGQLQTAISAVTSNDIGSKTDSELKLLSVPIVYCAAYESEPWHQFLAKVTSFTLALCHWDNGAGWNLNVYGSNDAAGEMARHLPDFFLNHLRKVKELHIYGDGSWPLGAAPALINEIEVGLPGDSSRIPVLEHVRFKQFFICNELEEFLLKQVHNLRSIDLTDCFASGEAPEEEPNWTSFFSKLVDAQPKQLTQITVENACRTLEDLLGGNGDHPPTDDDDPEIVARKEVQDILATQQTERAQLTHPVRKKQLLAHVTIDDKYGMIFDSEEVNVSVFLEGSAHKQWLRLVDLMEENEQRVESEITPSGQRSQPGREPALRSRR